MKNELKEHKIRDMIKWIVVFVLILALFGCFAYSMWFSLYLYYDGNMPSVIPQFTTSVDTSAISDTDETTSTTVTSVTSAPVTEPQAAA